MKNNIKPTMKGLTREFHPTKTYALKPWRAKKLEMVNRLVRGGATYKEIARMLNVSTTTVARLHCAFADNCLSHHGQYSYVRDGRSVMYAGACCAI
jgi:transposase-like protein